MAERHPSAQERCAYRFLQRRRQEHHAALYVLLERENAREERSAKLC